MRHLIKDILKTLFISFIGVSLIHGQIMGGIVIPQVRAEEGNPDTTPGRTNPDDEDDQGNDDSGHEERSLQTNEVQPQGEDDLLSERMITMYVIGIITAGLYQACEELTADIIIVAAGGLAYIAAEMKAQDEFEDINDQLEHKYTVNSQDITVQNEQYEALVSEKEVYQDVVSTMEEKKSLQETAKTAFMTATAIATAQEIARLMQWGVALGTASASCPYSNCCADVVTLTGSEAVLAIPSTSKDSELESFANSAQCSASAYFQTLMNTMIAVCNPDSMTVGNHFSNPKPDQGRIEKMLSLILPKANAGQYDALFASAGAGALAAAIAASLKSSLAQFFSTPMHRIIAFGILTKLTDDAIERTEETIEEAEKNIAKIDEVLQNYEELGDAPVDDGSGDGNQRNDIPDGLPDGNNDYGSGGGEEGMDDDEDYPCITGRDSGDGCRPMSEPNTEIASESNFGLSDSLRSSANTIHSVGNGINGSSELSKGTLEDARSMGGKSQAIRDELRNLKDRLNDKRKSEGKEPVDFESRENELQKELLNKTKKALQDSGVSTKEALARFNLPEEDKEKKESSGETTDNKKKVTKMKNSSNSKSDEEKEEDKKNKLDLGLDDTSKEEDKEQTAEEMAGLEKDEELVMDDISQKKDKSIFQIISVRYLKSGYKRLSEQEKKEQKQQK